VVPTNRCKILYVKYIPVTIYIIYTIL
jgi:hypothetical protein